MAAYDLCTLDDVREYMGMTGSKPTVDELLKDLITRVSDKFHTICGVTQLKLQSYTKQYSGNGTDTLIIYDERPLVEITSLAQDSDWVFAADTTCAADTYMILDDSIVFRDNIFLTGKGNIQVMFTSGFAIIPYDLVQACAQDVFRIYKLRDNIDIATKSFDSGGSFTKVQQGMTDDVKQTLRKYMGRGVY